MKPSGATRTTSLVILLALVMLAGCAKATTPTFEQAKNRATDNTAPMTREETSEAAMKLLVGDTSFTATLVENSSTDALKALLAEGPVTVHMRDYGSMEKVGDLGRILPTNDRQTTTQAGDLILYQGRALVIYYAPNSWSFTKLGSIDDVTSTELKKVLGSGDVTVTLTLD